MASFCKVKWLHGRMSTKVENISNFSRLSRSSSAKQMVMKHSVKKTKQLSLSVRQILPPPPLIWTHNSCGIKTRLKVCICGGLVNSLISKHHCTFLVLEKQTDKQADCVGELLFNHSGNEIYYYTMYCLYKCN